MLHLDRASELFHIHPESPEIIRCMDFTTHCLLDFPTLCRIWQTTASFETWFWRINLERYEILAEIFNYSKQGVRVNRRKSWDATRMRGWWIAENMNHWIYHFPASRLMTIFTNRSIGMFGSSQWPLHLIETEHRGVTKPTALLPPYQKCDKKIFKQHNSLDVYKLTVFWYIFSPRRFHN